MAKLPIISGATCVQALSRIGYEVVRQRGSHVRLTHAHRRSLTVLMHKALTRGTLHGILQDADLSVDAFLALL